MPSLCPTISRDTGRARRIALRNLMSQCLRQTSPRPPWPPSAAEVDLDHILELLDDVERLRGSPPEPTGVPCYDSGPGDAVSVSSISSGQSRSAANRWSACQASLLGSTCPFSQRLT